MSFIAYEFKRGAYIDFDFYVSASNDGPTALIL
jgi:hypothetical protein